MDTRPHDAARQAVHGLVSLQPRAVVGAALGPLVVSSLLGGIAGGLLRVGLQWSATAGAAWLGHATQFHAALMVSGFLGSVIGIERAVAVKRRAAWLAPLASGLGGLFLLLGRSSIGAWLGVAAAMVFVVVNVVVVHRQRAANTVLLLVSAFAWLLGNLLFASGIGRGAPLPWWFAFLVLTIAAERLEMTRLTRHRPEAQLLLGLVLTVMLIGAAAFATAPAIGGLLFGSALTLLAAWLGVYDIARRTVFAHGLARYMALALLGGYAWLAIAGLAWIGMVFGLPLRDVSLHALGLGFIVSMVMGHAPVILPAVARIKLQFSGWFYGPLALLHLSLVWRLAGGTFDFAARADGALFNAVAIASFVITIAAAAFAWRRRHSAPSAPTDLT